MLRDLIDQVADTSFAAAALNDALRNTHVTTLITMERITHFNYLLQHVPEEDYSTTFESLSVDWNSTNFRFANSCNNRVSICDISFGNTKCIPKKDMIPIEGKDSRHAIK